MNDDGVVGFDDLVVLAQNYGSAGKTFSTGNVDYSADGLVDFNDLVILAQNYNNSLAAVAGVMTPPSPASIVTPPKSGKKVAGKGGGNAAAVVS